VPSWLIGLKEVTKNRGAHRAGLVELTGQGHRGRSVIMCERYSSKGVGVQLTQCNILPKALYPQKREETPNSNERNAVRGQLKGVVFQKCSAMSKGSKYFGDCVSVRREKGAPEGKSQY